VDRDADTVDSMALLLSLSGHRARVARDGPSALRAAQSRSPDVVLLDVALPGMDGWQLAERLQEQAGEKGPFLIAVTAYGQPAHLDRSREAGIHLHLLKPASPVFLLEVLRRFRAFLVPGETPESSGEKRGRRGCVAARAPE
jgi:CheY-like chemotaxis protein